MDDGLIEGVGAMTRFVNLLVADPETSRVPFMIDSSKVGCIHCHKQNAHIQTANLESNSSFMENLKHGKFTLNALISLISLARIQLTHS